MSHRALLVAASAALGLEALPAQAFKPAEEYGHRGLTRTALSRQYDISVLNITPAAVMVQAVIAGNEGTDGLTPSNLLICEPGDGSNLGIPFFQANNHCDDELIGACSQLINRLIGNTVGFVVGGEVDRARTCLGRALHTTQDFYAHSTEAIRVFSNSEAQYRTETAPGRSRSGLGIVTRSSLISGTLNAESGANACTGNQFVPEMTPPNVYVGDVLRADIPPLITGFFPGMADLVLIEGAPLWVIRPPFGLPPLPPPGHWEPPATHCGHGIDRPLESLGQITRGIAKDRADSQPGWVHLAARDLALEASTDLISRVVSGVRTRAASEAEASVALERFFGVPVPTAPVPGATPPPPPPPRPNTHVGAVIDVTESMGAVIAGVKDGVAELTLLAEQANDSGASSFTLVSYADPVIAAPLVTTDPAEFSAAVESLVEGYLGGGGDCREPTFAAIRTALDAMPSPGDLYVFTNASAKDGELEPSIAEDAAARDISIHIINSGSCSPIDPAYKALSLATGGTFVEQEPRNPDAPREFLALQALNLQAGNQQLVLGVDRTIVDPEVIPFEVDSTSSRLMVATDMSAVEIAEATDATRKGQIVLIDPAGNPVAPVVDGYVGNHYAVDAPAAGTWTLQVSGAAGKRLSAQVNVQSSLDPLSVEFLEERGRPGHTGLMPRVDRPPLEPSTLRVRVGDASVADLTFTSRRLDGSELSTLATQFDESAAAHQGDLTPPAEPFRITVQGRLPDGSIVQRAESRVFEASPFQLFESADNVVLVPGVRSVLRAAVSNRGPATELNMTLESDVLAELVVEPRTFSIGAGETKLVELRVTLPADGIIAGAARFTLWAQEGADRSSGNFLQTARYIDTDDDDDGTSDRVEQGPTLDDAAYDGNLDDIPDWQQAEVVSLPFLLGQYSSVELGVARPLRDVRPVPVAPDAVLPDAATAVPFGAVRMTIEDTSRTEPVELRLILPQTNGYPIDRLLAYEPDAARWVRFAEFDPATSSFTMTATDGAEHDVFAGAGRLELLLAPAYAATGAAGTTSAPGNAQPEDEADGCGCRIGPHTSQSNAPRGLPGLLLLGAALARRVLRRRPGA